MHRAIHFLCVCLCVRACICFQWQWVHFILNAPVSLRSRTRSDQVLVTKLKQHKTKQKCVFCLSLVQDLRRYTGRRADIRKNVEEGCLQLGSNVYWQSPLPPPHFILFRVSPCVGGRGLTENSEWKRDH